MKRKNHYLALAVLVALAALGSPLAWAVPAETQAAAQAPININQANADELMSLNGIGAATAERIIAYRQEQGPFQTVDQLVMVKGIGNAKFEKIKNLITV